MHEGTLQIPLCDVSNLSSLASTHHLFWLVLLGPFALLANLNFFGAPIKIMETVGKCLAKI